MKKDSIMLTAVQRRSLEQVISRGKSSAWTITHAQVLLKVDRGPLGPGWSTSQIIEAFSVSRSTVERVCKRFPEAIFIVRNKNQGAVFIHRLLPFLECLA